MDNEKCNINTALAELNLMICFIDLAKAKNELVHLFLQLKLEAIDNTNSNEWGVYCFSCANRAGTIWDAPNKFISYLIPSPRYCGSLSVRSCPHVIVV